MPTPQHSLWSMSFCMVLIGFYFSLYGLVVPAFCFYALPLAEFMRVPFWPVSGARLTDSSVERGMTHISQLYAQAAVVAAVAIASRLTA